MIGCRVGRVFHPCGAQRQRIATVGSAIATPSCVRHGFHVPASLPTEQPAGSVEATAPQIQSVAPSAQSAFVDTGYWDWCEAQFDMSEFRSAKDGLIPSRAKCACDSLLAQVDVALREVGKILHPQALIYATQADMYVLVASLPQGDPKATLERLGSEGVTLTSNIK